VDEGVQDISVCAAAQGGSTVDEDAPVPEVGAMREGASVLKCLSAPLMSESLLIKRSVAAPGIRHPLSSGQPSGAKWGRDPRIIRKKDAIQGMEVEAEDEEQEADLAEDRFRVSQRSPFSADDKIWLWRRFRISHVKDEVYGWRRNGQMD